MNRIRRAFPHYDGSWEGKKKKICRGPGGVLLRVQKKVFAGEKKGWRATHHAGSKKRKKKGSALGGRILPPRGKKQASWRRRE